MCKLLLKDILSANFYSNKNIITNTLPKDIGSDFMEKLPIQDGFLIMKSNYIFFKPTQIEAKQKERKFVITISLKGDAKYINLDGNNIIPFKQGFTTISLFDETEGIREFYDKEINQIRIILNESFLRENLHESVIEKYTKNSKTDLNLISFTPTMIQSQLIVNDIINCSLKGELGKLYLQGKALELLHIELTNLEIKNNKIITLDSYDKKAILKAKEILINNMKNPPSIVELSKLVHINEVKLKTGFKEIFNTSPYRLLLKYKMNEAKKLLEMGEYNINEVADITGYKFASNFTNAFYKEFKILPKSILKDKKNFFI